MKGMIACLLLLLTLCAGFALAGEAPAPPTADSNFPTSLHATSRGMAYWYDKARGGMEAVSGTPYGDLPCKNCHTASCDVCHAVEKGKTADCSAANTRGQDICLSCHEREKAVMEADKAAGTEDVHAAAGMGCLDCHGSQDLHGDGKVYDSMKQEGAIEPRCEKCHDKISRIEPHKMHRKKLDCASCHVRQVVSCTNCHMETLAKEGKKVAIPVSGLVFLMNARGTVTAANAQSFVLPGNKTFVLFAPQFSHSVMKKGRACRDCHNNENIRQIRKENKIALTWLADGKVASAKGAIPVGEGVSYEFVYQNREGDAWTPIANPAPPVVQYAGYGSPLTKQQMTQLAQSR